MKYVGNNKILLLIKIYIQSINILTYYFNSIELLLIKSVFKR